MLTLWQMSLLYSFHNYFVSQASVFLILSTSMTIAYLILQVPYGSLLGFAVGIGGMVPYVAAIASSAAPLSASGYLIA